MDNKCFKISQYFFLLFFLLSGLVLSEEQTIGRKHPFTILVLSGGGARGIAHIGVLKVLEELHIPVDMVVGTSMGAIVGGLYAAGLSPSEIEKKMLEVDWDDIFSDNPKPMQQPYRLRKDLSKYMQGVEIGYAVDQIQIPQGMIAGQKLRIALNNILLPVLSVDDFDRLPLPFRAVATDLVTGERVNLSSGSLTKAIMASMSIPGIFAPVEIDNRILVDGGVVANLAIETARELGAERIIAVDVSSQLLSKDELKNLVDVTKQVLAIYGRRNHLYQLSLLKKDDILLSLKLEGLSNTDFKKAKEIIREGESAAIEKKELLASASVSEEEYRQIKSYVSARNRKEPVIVDFIEILPPKKVSPLIVEKRIKTAVGKKLDLDTLEQDITNIYATGLFERVDYQITRMDENYGLKIEPITKPWGPNYLYLGLQFDSTRDFNPLLRYRMTQMNLRGGELNIYLKMGIDHIIEAEFYQPIDYGDHFFIAPSFSYHQRNTDLYKDDDRYARYRTRTTSTGLYGGVNIGNEGQFRAGIEGENLTSEPSIGDITLPEYEDNLFLLNSSFVIDHLDNLLFPESGWYFSADYSTPFPGLEEQEFHKLLLKGLGAWSNKHNTILAYLEAGSSFDTELPLYRSFTLGGFQRISGLNLDELIGNYEGLFRITYIRSFAKTLPFSITGYFIGSSIETGNVWEEVDNISLEDMKLSGSIFSGVKTPLGPVYIGYGIRSLEKGIFYFYLGPVF